MIQNKVPKDLSQTILNSPYQFVLLHESHIPQIIELIAHAFSKENDFTIAMKMTYQITYDYVKNRFNLQNMLKDKLSYGAFSQDKLVSLSLAFDLETQYLNYQAQIPQQAQNRESYTVFPQFTQKYKFQPNQCIHLFYMATDSKHIKNQLASICCYLSNKQAQERGFTNYVTEASHPATQKLIQSIFSNCKSEFYQETIIEGQMVYKQILHGTIDKK